MTTTGTVFVSDIHIHFGDAPYRDQFVRFLRRVSTLGDRLYIHGDLFDFYVGPKQGRLPFYAPLFDAIRDLRAAGVRVFVMVGNRDFTMQGDPGFIAAGAELVPDEVLVDLGGRTAHLSHGDQFCLDDRSYLASRAVLRFAPITALVRSMPWFIASSLAKGYRKHSARKMAKHRDRGTNRLASILRGVENLVSHRQFDFVICGHIHYLAETPISTGYGTRLFTTGAWEEGPNCLVFDGADLRILRV